MLNTAARTPHTPPAWLAAGFCASNAHVPTKRAWVRAADGDLETEGLLRRPSRTSTWPLCAMGIDTKGEKTKIECLLGERKTKIECS